MGKGERKIVQVKTCLTYGRASQLGFSRPKKYPEAPPDYPLINFSA
jgi:hypothetical protein